MRRRPLTGAGSIVQSVRSAQGAEVVRRHGKQRPSFRSEVKDVPRTPTLSLPPVSASTVGTEEKKDPGESLASKH